MNKHTPSCFFKFILKKMTILPMKTKMTSICLDLFSCVQSFYQNNKSVLELCYCIYIMLISLLLIQRWLKRKLAYVEQERWIYIYKLVMLLRL